MLKVQAENETFMRGDCRIRSFVQCAMNLSQLNRALDIASTVPKIAKNILVRELRGTRCLLAATLLRCPISKVIVCNIGGDDPYQCDQRIVCGSANFEFAKQPAMIGTETDKRFLYQIVHKREFGEAPRTRNPEDRQSDWLLEPTNEFRPCFRVTSIYAKPREFFRGYCSQVHWSPCTGDGNPDR